MKSFKRTSIPTEPLLLKNLQLLNDVTAGFSQVDKSLPAKYFYDEFGSLLFERICNLPEYYLSQVESKILNYNISEIVKYFQKGSLLIELGSGSSRKTRLILKNLPQIGCYIPVDISQDFLLTSVDDLKLSFPNLNIYPHCCDFMELKSLPDPYPQIFSTQQKVIFMPGSTIGNLDLNLRSKLLKNIKSLLGPGNDLILGIDLAKEKKVLENAYNDKEGITGQFNLNILSRINRELSANFDLSSFRHHAFFNSEKSRIEMHLVSLKDQVVTIPSPYFREFFFKEGESIHTENSYKFELQSFLVELKSLGFVPQKIWTDENNYFAELYLRIEMYARAG